MTNHRRVHTKERPFPCEFPECALSFPDSSALARHRRTHTGRRYWTCDRPDCTKTFSRRLGLVAHMKAHEEDDAEAEAARTPAAEANLFPSTSIGPPKKRRRKNMEDQPKKLTPAEIEKQKALMEQGYQLFVHAYCLVLWDSFSDLHYALDGVLLARGLKPFPHLHPLLLRRLPSYLANLLIEPGQPLPHARQGKTLCLAHPKNPPMTNLLTKKLITSRILI